MIAIARYKRSVIGSVSPALLARFRADLDALSPPGEPIALAVSGGPDSLALLLLAAAARPVAMEALTVDHGLRPEAAAEAAMVASLCAAVGVPHTTLRCTVAAAGEGLQAAARAARYAAMAAHVGAGRGVALATAHHADDQAETLLMRLGRGAGLAGLAGIRAATLIAGCRVIRPLLGWRRATLAGIVEEAGLVPADDPSNHDPRHDRTRTRAMLAMAPPMLDPARLAASAGHLAEAEEALAWIAEEALRGRLEQRDDAAILAIDGLPREIVRRMLRLVLSRFGTETDGPALDRAITRLGEGRPVTLGMARLRAVESRVIVTLAPPRRGKAI